MPLPEIRNPLHKKESKLFCHHCHRHIFTLAIDVFWGDKVDEQMFEPNEGQGPWRNGALCACKCGFKWFIGDGPFMGVWK